MATSAFNKFNSFTEAVAEKVHNLGADVLEVALTKRGGQFIDAISCSAMEPPRLTIVALRC